MEGVNALEVHPSLDGGISNEDTEWDDAFWRHDRQASDEAQGTSVLVNTTEKTEFTVGTAQALSCEGADWKAEQGEKWVGLHADMAPSSAVEVTKFVGWSVPCTCPPRSAKSKPCAKLLRSRDGV